MFGKSTVVDFITRSAENPTDRRRFLRSAGLAGIGVAGAAALGTATAGTAAAADDGAATDAAVLNFALNLEYLEAEYYLNAVYGHGLPDSMTTGKGTLGGVKGGAKVNFRTPAIAAYAREIAGDERDHVGFLRGALGGAAVARPALDIDGAFTTVARAAGLIGPTQTVSPYANEDYFLLGAFLFEDVGVTAYKGAAPLITNKTYLEAAAGILAVEAYHAGIVRTSLYAKGMADRVQQLSDLRDALDNTTDDDQGIVRDGKANLVPTDANGLAYSRTTGDVLNIVYGTPKMATSGLFYPAGVNGVINTSSAG